MKKIIPTIIVEDYCDNCIYLCCDGWCNKDEQQRYPDYVSNAERNKSYPIPDWCPLGTLEETNDELVWSPEMLEAFEQAKSDFAKLSETEKAELKKKYEQATREIDPFDQDQ